MHADSTTFPSRVKLLPILVTLAATSCLLPVECTYISLSLLIDMEVNFRKIDVDQYDEDALLDSEVYEADPRDPAQVLNDTKQKATAVRSSLSKYVPCHTNTCI